VNLQNSSEKYFSIISCIIMFTLLFTKLLRIVLLMCVASASVLAQQTIKTTPKPAPKLTPTEEELQKRVTPKISKLDFRGAVEEVSVMILRDTANVTLYNVRASLFAQLYKFDEAGKDFDKIIALQPNNLYALQSRAQLRVEHLNNPDGAIQDWTRVVAIDSLNPSAWFSRGALYQAKQKFDSARSDYSSCLRVGNGESILALTQRGFCQMKLKQTDQAMTDFSNAIKLGSADSTGRGMLFDAWFYRGSLHLQRRKFPEAIFDLDAALRLNDQSGETYYLRGYAKMLAGRNQDGCIDVSQAKELKYVGAGELLDKYCDDMPSLDSLRRYTMPTVTVTAGRSPAEIAITDSRRLLRRVQGLVANPSLAQSQFALPTTGLTYQAPPGMMSPFDCNKQRLEMTRPSQISVGCIAQVLQDELRKVNDANVRAMVNDVMNIANDLYLLEQNGLQTDASGNSNANAQDQINGNQAQLLRLRLSEQFRELNVYLEKMQTAKK
jgi:tetratricopeptide (TPR) repeat protein